MLYAWKLEEITSRSNVTTYSEKDLPVDVFLRANGFSYAPFAVSFDMITKRQLYQYAADFVVTVQSFDDANDFVDFSTSWDPDMLECDTDFLRSLSFHTNVGRGVLTIAHLDDSELWLKARIGCLEGLDPIGDTLTD